MPPLDRQLDDNCKSTVIVHARFGEDPRPWELPPMHGERVRPRVVCRSSSALWRQSWLSISVPDPVAHAASVRASLQVNRLSEAFELPDLRHTSWLVDADTSPILKDELETGREQKRPADRSSAIGESCPPNNQDVQGEFLEGHKLFIVMACVSSVVFLMFLDGSILSPAIATITDEFDSLGDIGWYGSAYYLANTALQPLAGRFYSYFRSKWCLIVYVALFMFGSLICGVAPSSNIFIIGRAVAGAGSSGILIGNLTVIAGVAPLEKRPSLTALVMSLSAPGMLFGPLVGGVITQYSSWRLVFYINLPFGAVIIPLLLFSNIPDQMVKPKAMEVIRNLPSYIDFPGFFLLSGASISLLLALNWGGEAYKWSSPVIIGTMVAAGVLLVLFLAWGVYKGEGALIPTSVARQMVVWSGAMNLAFLLGATTIQAYFLPLYFQAVRGDSVMNSALYTLPGLPSLIIFSMVSGILIGKMGAYLPWALAGAAIHTVACGLFGTFSPSSSAAQWVTYQVLAGAARGMCMQSPSIAVQVSLPEDQISIASSILTFGMSMGQSIASTVASTAFTNVLTEAMTQAVGDIGEGAPSVESVLIAGATGFRDLVSAADLPRMLVAYNDSIRIVFLLATVFSSLSFLFAFGLGSGDARRKAGAEKSSEELEHNS